MFDHEIINFAEKSKRQQFSDVFAFFSVSEDGLNEWIFFKSRHQRICRKGGCTVEKKGKG